MDKKEFRVLIKYCFLMEENTAEAKTWLDAEFPDTAPGKSTIKDCLISSLRLGIPRCGYFSTTYPPQK
ncbi:hypothetical protein GWI33_002497 [Rhynchophorus ferrugineus]|uniref:DUF4817 domain-containing protein n=1 Tax=Rhynchophorus ferrugineus TaxID=354439 RepID=A0A834IVN6_RHYFE|nr:hypothetical protein GWI33_002497 [Rhynchophorus ferrugineus]